MKTIKALLLVLTIFSNQVFALDSSQIEISAKKAYRTPGYKTGTTINFNLDYINYEIPWGAKVYLRYGKRILRHVYIGSGSFYDWQNVREVELKASGSYQWSVSSNFTDVISTIMDRTQALQFAIRIVLPDGREVWDNGGISQDGYYQANLSTLKLDQDYQKIHPFIVK